MAIQTKKLSEVEIIESPVNPNFIVEDEGEIKRIPPESITPSQVQADWEETDASSPAYILNKPESLGGGGGEIVYYYIASDILMEEATSTQATAQASKAKVIDQWNGGARIRIRHSIGVGGNYDETSGDVIGISYSLASGFVSGNVTLSYVQGGGTTISTVSVTNP